MERPRRRRGMGMRRLVKKRYDVGRFASKKTHLGWPE
jgi:hypothetical protein